MELSIRPKDFELKGLNPFGGSALKNIQAELTASYIVFVCQKLNPEDWSEFSGHQYSTICIENQKNLYAASDLDVLVDGGRPLATGFDTIEGGYLQRRKSYGQSFYSVTEKFFNLIECKRK